MRFLFRRKKERSSSLAVSVSEMLSVGAIRQFPARHAVGVDLSDASVEAVAVRRERGGQFRLQSFNRVELPEGVVWNGEILNAGVLATALRELFAGGRPARFPSNLVVFSLPESKVYLRTFEFPRTFTEAQVRSAVGYEAEGVLPLALDEVYADAVIHRSREDRYHVLFAAVPRRVVDMYVGVLTAGGLTPVAFDVESEALTRSLVGDRAEPVIVLDIGANISTTSIVERGAVHASVSMEHAGRAFTALVERASGVSSAEAEELKKSKGMSGEAPPAVRQALEAAVVTILKEVQRTAGYHESHTGRKPVELVLTGGSVQLPGLAEFLRERTGLPVRVGDPIESLQVALPSRFSPAERAQLDQYRSFLAPSLGLAVRGAANDPAAAGINLLPDRVKRPYLLWRENLAVSVFSAATAFVLLVFVALFGGRSVQLLLRQRALDSSERGSLATLFGLRIQEALDTARVVNGEIGLLESFDRQRGDALGMFQRIRSAFGTGIHVTSLSFELPPRPGTAVVALRGAADTRERFLEFEARLKKLEGLQVIDSPLSNLDQPVGVLFQVRLTFATSR